MADTLNVFISFESCQCFYNLIFSFLVIHSDYMYVTLSEGGEGDGGAVTPI